MVVAIHNFYPVLPGESSVAIHDESDMCRDGALTQSSEKKLLQALDAPFDRRKLKQDSVELGDMQRGGHCR